MAFFKLQANDTVFGEFRFIKYVEAKTASNALVQEYGDADSFGQWYATKTLKWSGRGMGRQKTEWAEAVEVSPQEINSKYS